MVKNHIKTLAVPRAWPVKRKNKIWITRPNGGSQKLDASLPLNVVLRDLLEVASTSKEVKYILNNNDVLIDQNKKTDKKHSVGIMDTISLPLISKQYRLTYSKYGKLSLVEISQKEAAIKPAKIINKTCLKGKFQINLGDGRNILVSKNDYKTGDSLLLELPSQKILKHLPLGKGAYIFLTGGKHLGTHGKVESIQEDHITFKAEGKLVKTLIKYALVVGKEKSEIKIAE